MSFEFEWDDAKRKANLKKHGVPFAEALTVFVDQAEIDEARDGLAAPYLGGNPSEP